MAYSNSAYEINPRALEFKSSNLPYPKFLSGLDQTNRYKPAPRKCECGNYPRILQKKNQWYAKCQGCDAHSKGERTYSIAVVSWNELATTNQPDSLLEVYLPTVSRDTTIEKFVDNADLLLYQVDTLINQKLVKLTNIEYKQLHLFARLIKLAITQANRLKVNDSLHEYSNNESFVEGPLSEFRDYLHYYGDKLYYVSSGHALQVRVDDKTGFHIPKHVVNTTLKNQKSKSFQVRIDRRSLGLPYYSRNFTASDEETALYDALHCLNSILKALPLESRTGHVPGKYLSKSSALPVGFWISGRHIFYSLVRGIEALKLTVTTRFQFDSQFEFESSYQAALQSREISRVVCSNPEFVYGEPIRYSELSEDQQNNVLKLVLEKVQGIKSFKRSAIQRHIENIDPVFLKGFSTIQPDHQPSEIPIICATTRFNQPSKPFALYRCINADPLIFGNLSDYIVNRLDEFTPGEPRFLLGLERSQIDKLVETSSCQTPDRITLKTEKLLKEIAESLKIPVSSKKKGKTSIPGWEVDARYDPVILWGIDIKNRDSEKSDEQLPIRTVSNPIKLPSTGIRRIGKSSTRLKGVVIRPSGSVTYRTKTATGEKLNTLGKPRNKKQAVEYLTTAYLTFNGLRELNDAERKHINSIAPKIVVMPSSKDLRPTPKPKTLTTAEKMQKALKKKNKGILYSVLADQFVPGGSPQQKGQMSATILKLANTRPEFTNDDGYISYNPQGL